jgi:type II secretory pathway pseudopilin PulG
MFDVRCSSSAIPRGILRRFTTAATASAFSLVEILIVMSLLSLIILGLMTMFSQTQRAFRSGLMQTDIMESGRLATDLLTRELEQVTPSGHFKYYVEAGGKSYLVPNFSVNLTLNSSILGLPNYSNDGLTRTNILEDLFFLTRENQTWTGIGYFARTNRSLGSGTGPVCTLYRFQMTDSAIQFEQAPHLLYEDFTNACAGTVADDEKVSEYNVSKVMDGVVHFRIRPCDDGGWVIPSNPSWTNSATWNNFPPAVLDTNLDWSNVYLPLGERNNYAFYSNVVPAFVEFEIGILEQQTLDRYKSLPTPIVQANYLTNQAGRVHLFRQRVAIRNVDLSVYQ